MRVGDKLGNKIIKNKFILTISCILIIGTFIMMFSFIRKTNVITVMGGKFLNGLGIYTGEVKTVEITSDDYNNPGSWHINKSAKWIGLGKAEVTYDVDSIIRTDANYKDVVLVLDISGSMKGDKLDKAISDAQELVSYLLSNENNRVAIVTFNSTSTIISSFSSDKDDLINKLDGLVAEKNTNYNSALLNVDRVMNGYVKEDNRDIVTLFLTDGYPNEDTPNQVGAYEVLKDKYPYMMINGVQYEMGSDVVDEIKQITDSQWVADQSTLNNVLFEASVSPVVYEEFVITDYVHDDYFYINSVNDIKVSMGKVKLEDEDGVQKIIWDLGDNSYMTGGRATMTFNLSLREQYIGSEGYYPTNKSEVITSKLPDVEKMSVGSNNTPVLKASYEVIYDTNAPDGCSTNSIENERHFVYENVSIKSDELVCDGYLFRGWEIASEDEKDIQKVNDDVFVMPVHDVTIRATWSRQSIVKSMEGTVHENTTLYKVLKNEVSSGLAREYTGKHQDTIDGLGDQKIYYYYASNPTNGNSIINKNNVVFADMCWQMIRTTDTGGVKMIYNGEADSEGKCGIDRETHVGYSSRTTTSLSSNYYYGNSYKYDSATKKFSLDGGEVLAKWSATVGPTLVGKYTCKSSASNGTCSTLYYVESYYNTSSAYVIPLNSSAMYYGVGIVQFNGGSNSLAYVGYMYGDVYSNNLINILATETFTSTEEMLLSYSLSTGYWYADDITYGTSATNKYSLVEPYKVSSSSEYSSLVGKYTFRNTTESYTNSTVNYIAGVSSYTMYYKQLSGGNYLSTYEPIIFGDSLSDNGDGTYTLNNPKSVLLTDWVNDYATYKNMYTCNNSSDTCSNPRFITATSVASYDYVSGVDEILIAKGRNGGELTDTLLVKKSELITNPSLYSEYKYTCNNKSSSCGEANLRMVTSYKTTGYGYAKNHYFGSSVTYDGKNYTLVDPIGIENYSDLSSHHYMCVDNGKKQCSTVAYIHYTVSGNFNYIILKDGDLKIEDVLNKMLKNNTNNSVIMNAINAWYERYLIDYSGYLEDTIFCNDRSIKELNGWNPNGGVTNKYLYFKEYSETKDLYCTNEIDRFSVSNEIAKLKYPVGLMTSPEMNLSNSDYVRKAGSAYWLASPYYAYNTSYNRRIQNDGSLSFANTNGSYTLRPAISLAPGTEYSDGDGSRENPYVVELGV